MREYGVLRISFWTDAELSVKSDAANRLAAYYITGSHTTLIGCFRCPVGYVCSDLHWTPEKVAAAERELGAFVHRDGEWVFLPTYLRWNPIENPRIAARLLQQVPTRLVFYRQVALSIGELGSQFSKTYFIRRADGPIKIGRSVNPIARLAKLQTSCPEPLELLCVTDLISESAAHQQFAHLRIAGEWFTPANDLLKFIDELNKKEGR